MQIAFSYKKSYCIVLIKRTFSYMIKIFYSTLLTALVFIINISSATAQERNILQQPVMGQLLADLESKGFKKEELIAILALEKFQYNENLARNRMENLLNSSNNNNSQKNLGWKNFFTADYFKPQLLWQAFEYYNANRELFLAIEKKFQVSPQAILAIYLVESKLGTEKGDYLAINVLLSYVLSSKYLQEEVLSEKLAKNKEQEQWLLEKIDSRAKYFYKELIALLIYAKEMNRDVYTFTSSVSGAIGFCQFMPSNIAVYGADANNDGLVDVYTKEDALASIAKYLQMHGWKEGLSEEEYESVYFSYNNSTTYAQVIRLLAESFNTFAH